MATWTDETVRVARARLLCLDWPDTAPIDARWSLDPEVRNRSVQEATIVSAVGWHAKLAVGRISEYARANSVLHRWHGQTGIV